MNITKLIALLFLSALSFCALIALPIYLAYSAGFESFVEVGVAACVILLLIIVLAGWSLNTLLEEE